LHYYLADDTVEMLENLPRTGATRQRCDSQPANGFPVFMGDSLSIPIHALPALP
jgi:hypothetical protein